MVLSTPTIKTNRISEPLSDVAYNIMARIKKVALGLAKNVATITVLCCSTPVYNVLTLRTT